MVARGGSEGGGDKCAEIISAIKTLRNCNLVFTHCVNLEIKNLHSLEVAWFL